MVNVFFPAAAADTPPGKRAVTATAAETARNSRRDIVARELKVKVSVPSDSFAESLSIDFINGLLAL
jgi:hypothetical protein